MIVWGGFYIDEDVECPPIVNRRSGGVFDPQRGFWRRMSNHGAPPARALHTAVWTGQEMIIWGGVDLNTNKHFGDGARFLLR